MVYTDTVENRSYKGKTVSASNAYMLDTLKETKEAMGDKPVIVYMRENKPVVFSEVEPLADAIVIGYGISDQAAVEIIAGATEPSGLLPMQEPANMETVEAQCEDVPVSYTHLFMMRKRKISFCPIRPSISRYWSASKIIRNFLIPGTEMISTSHSAILSMSFWIWKNVILLLPQHL